MRKSLTEVPGEVDLPKFQITYSQSLVKSLQALGMHDAFQSGVAEFDSMIDPPYHLSISDVKHKTYLAVDEDGTEAAAATSVEMVKSLARPSHIEPFKMVVDHPFLCAIVNRETSAIAFLGEINDPTAK
jgi:serpin B